MQAPIDDDAPELPPIAWRVLRHPAHIGPVRPLSDLRSLVVETDYSIDHPLGLAGYIESVTTALVTVSSAQPWPLLIDPGQIQPLAHYGVGEHYFPNPQNLQFLLPQFQSSIPILQIVGQGAWRPSRIHGESPVARSMRSIWVFGRICADTRGWPGNLLAPLLCRREGEDETDSEVDNN